MYHKWQSYDVWLLRYEAWQTEFFLILYHFLPFYPPLPPPPSNPENKNFEKIKKKKKSLEISSTYTSVPKIMILCYTVPDIWYVTDVIVIFHFGLFFCHFTPLTAQKIKIKMKKTPQNIIISHMGTKNYDQMMYGFWDMVRHRRTDRWTDGETDGETDRRIYGRTDEWTDRRTDGRTDRGKISYY